jgi:hypothetical protein
VSAADRDVLRSLDPTIVNAIVLKPFDVLHVGAYVKNAVTHRGPDRRRARIVREG